MVAGKVGFVYSTKDRVALTRRSFPSFAQTPGFEIVWVDGSTSEEGIRLPYEFQKEFPAIVEVHSHVGGGPDPAIRYGLDRLRARGYDYCGLIENDVTFQDRWLEALMELFERGSRDGLRVGCATVRTYVERALWAHNGYAVLWNVGAAMALFTRQAADILHAAYHQAHARTLSAFYRELAGNDLTACWELWLDQPNRRLGCDWSYPMQLYRCGLATLGTIPCAASTFDMDMESYFRVTYARDAAAMPAVSEAAWNSFKNALDARQGRFPGVVDRVQTAWYIARLRYKRWRHVCHARRRAAARLVEKAR